MSKYLALVAAFVLISLSPVVADGMIPNDPSMKLPHNTSQSYVWYSGVFATPTLPRGSILPTNVVTYGVYNGHTYVIDPSSHAVLRIIR